MNSKKITKISLGFVMFLALMLSVARVNADTISSDDWTRYQNSETNNGVTNLPGPTDADHAVSLWETNLDDPASSKTPPLIVGDYVYVACNKYVYCLNKKTGEQIKKSSELNGAVGFGLHPMVYANGKLFVLTGGSGAVRVEAFEADTLKKLWSSNGVSGTTYSPLAYKEIGGTGYLYSGTFQGDGKSGEYFCVKADDGTLVWHKEFKYGFYWDGAYVSENYMVFASENSEGSFGTKADSSLYVVNPINGTIIDSISGLKGNIRDTVTYDNGYIYVGTMDGYFYRIAISETGELTKSGDGFSYVDLDGPIRTPAIIHKERIYVGVGYASLDLNDPSGKYYYMVLDGSEAFNQSSIIYEVEVNGNPTGAPILSTAEEASTGNVTLYFACNREPGGIYYFTDSKNQTYGEVKTLFVPAEGQQEYCISSLALDKEGTLYYKNDSGYVMAVGSKLIQDVEVKTGAGSLSGISWNDRFTSSTKNYKLTVSDTVSELQFDVKKVNSDTDVSWKFIVDGAVQQENTVDVDKESTELELQVTRRGLTISYFFEIYKVTAQNTSLSMLYYGDSYSDNKNTLQDLEEDRTEYSVDLRKTSLNTPYLWVLPLHSSAKVEVYAVENLKDYYTGSALKSGEALDWVTQEKENSAMKYEVSPVDDTKNTVIRIRITSADGSTKQDYKVKFIRVDEKPAVTPPQTTQTPAASSQTTTTTTNNVTIAKPGKVSGLKAKKSKNKVTLSWKKVKGASGYQITVAKDKKLSKSKKQFTIKKASICKKTIKLTKKMKYLRVRAYTKKNGTTVYGNYSKIIKVN